MLIFLCFPGLELGLRVFIILFLGVCCYYYLLVIYLVISIFAWLDVLWIFFFEAIRFFVIFKGIYS